MSDSCAGGLSDWIRAVLVLGEKAHLIDFVVYVQSCKSF